MNDFFSGAARSCTIALLFLVGFGVGMVHAQRKDANSFPELTITPIAGAPTLSTPALVMAGAKPAMAEGAGWASPAFFDVTGDGRKDLLVGEYLSLAEQGTIGGNFVRVYSNIGPEEAPELHSLYRYLYPANGHHPKTVPLSIETWCCLGFTPRIVDLDNDGYPDLVSGQYDPGIITWFRGSEGGFLRGQPLPQFGDEMLEWRHSRHDAPWTDPESWFYWQYSSADFGDFNDDGLPDMITGGNTLRISKNIGRPEEPAFGRRELLLDTAGQPLRVAPATGEAAEREAGRPDCGEAMIPCVVDWDNDGVLDLLVSHLHIKPGSHAVTFFRGVKRGREFRFEPGVPLFTAAGGGKAFPGAWLHVNVADWNNDGVNDLLIGASVVTLNDAFDHGLSWDWEDGKPYLKSSPAYLSDDVREMREAAYKTAAHQLDSMRRNKRMSEDIAQSIYASRLIKFDSVSSPLQKEEADRMLQSVQQRYKLTNEEVQELFGYFVKLDNNKKPAFDNLAHKGYVYVMLGRKDGHD